MTRAASLVVAALLVVATACGGSSSTGESAEEKAREKAGESSMEKAADRTTCVADARAVAGLPTTFPQEFPFPAQTVVYDTEDRGAQGTIATGITTLPFKQVLAALNGTAQTAGFKVTSGETEEHDAEANWAGNGFRGRWAIRESATCDGETVVQVLAIAD